MNNNRHILWLDLETSGLDPTKHQILEVAWILTDIFGEVLEEGSHVIQPSGELAINAWALKQHTENGLLSDIMEEGASLGAVSAWIRAIINDYLGDEKVYLGGNSVSFDRSFVEEHMELVADILHYRNIDMTNFDQLLNAMGIQCGKGSSHRAKSDIEYSLHLYIQMCNAASEYFSLDV